MREGLHAPVIEQNSLPAIRQAIREEIATLRVELSAELREAAKKSDNRLAGLLVKAARLADIGQRMTYTVMAKAYGVEFAKSILESAQERAGKDLAQQDTP